MTVERPSDKPLEFVRLLDPLRCSFERNAPSFLSGSLFSLFYFIKYTAFGLILQLNGSN